MRPAEPNRSSSPALAPVESLDRLWEATRPAEPTAAHLDALWAHAAAELDRIDAARRAGADRLVPPVARRRRLNRWVVAGVVVGQAAAVLLAVGLGLIPRSGAPVAVVQQPMPIPVEPVLTPTVKPMVVVGAEQTLLIRIDAAGDRVVFLDQPPMGSSMADNTPHDFFNALEIAATP